MAILELAASDQKQDEDNEEASRDIFHPIDSEKGTFIEPFGRCNEGVDRTSCSVVEDYSVSNSFSKGMAADKSNSSFGEFEVEDPEMSEESVLLVQICNDHVKQINDKRLPEAILPMLRYHQYESSESSSSVRGSPYADENFRIHVEESELEETSSSGCDESSDYDEILEWAKANNHGSLQIICEYYRMQCPSRSSTINFHPLEHLHPVKFQRHAETVLYTAGSTIDLRSCSTSLEVADAHSALLAGEEATALSMWTVACLCGNLRLEHVLMIFAGALLEKQIVFICSNLGVLSALVLSIIPLIRPYQWRSLLMPVGVKDKSAEVQSKLSNVILVDANKNQLKTASVPQLPQHKELLTTLSSYYARLVGESYLAKKKTSP